MRVGVWIAVAALVGAGLWFALGGQGVDGPGLDVDDGTSDVEPDDKPSLTGIETADVETPLLATNDVTRVAGPPVTIAGVVTGSGRPLEGARVRIRTLFPGHLHGGQSAYSWNQVGPVRSSEQGTEIASTTSDTNGAFSVTLDRRSRHLVELQFTGYASRVLTVHTPVAGDPEPIEVDLAPGFDVTGVVVTDAGAPLRGLAVRLHGITEDAQADGSVLASATTDAAGHFALGPHGPGLSRLVVVTADGAKVRRRVNVPTTGGFCIVVPRGATVSGTLADADGQPVPRARVSIFAMDPAGGVSFESEATTGPAGAFRLTGVFGIVRDVVVRPEGGILLSAYTGAVEHDLSILRSGEDVEASIVLAKGGTLRGHVRPGDTAPPVSGTHVALIHFDRRLQVGITTVGADGAFAFHGVPSRDYILAAVDPGDPFRAAYHPSTGWSRAEGFSFDARSPLDLTLRLFGRVEGRLEIPANDFWSVRLGVGGLNVWASIGDDGGFVFPHVEPVQGATATASSIMVSGRSRGSEPFDIVAGVIVRPVISGSGRAQLRVKGTVSDGDGGPVAGAFVLMERDPNFQRVFDGWGSWSPKTPWSGVRTDADGAFDLEWEPPSEDTEPEEEAWSLRVTHPAFATTAVQNPGVPEEGHPIHVDVTLAPGVAARGRVLTPDGAPAVRAQVTVVQHGYRLATADADGWFEVPQLATGAWSVRASHAEGRFPLDETKYHPVETIETEPTLTLERVPVLAGRIVDETGAPVSLASVRARVPYVDDDDDSDSLQKIPAHMRERYKAELSRYGETVVGGEQADEQGLFRIECKEAGTFELVVEPGWRTRVGFLQTPTKAVETGRTDLVLVVRSGAKITGWVVDVDGKPVANAHVIGAWPEPEGWSMGMSHDNFRPMATTDADGQFTLAGLDNGPVGLVVAAKGFLPLHEKDVAVNAEVKLVVERGDAIEGTVLTPSGDPFVGLELKLVARPVAPKETDPKDAWKALMESRRNSLDAIVGSAVLHSHLNNRLEIKTDADGHFAFRGIDPGRYEILLERAMVGVDDPLFPKTVVQSNSPPFVVKTTGALSVSGVVVDQDGKPISYYTDSFASHPHVGCHQEGGKKQWSGETAWDFAEPDGTFEVGGLSPGPVRIVVKSGDDYSVEELETTAGATGIRIALQKLTDEEKKARDEAERERWKKAIEERAKDDDK